MIRSDRGQVSDPLFAYLAFVTWVVGLPLGAYAVYALGDWGPLKMWGGATAFIALFRVVVWREERKRASEQTDQQKQLTDYADRDE